MPQAFHLHYEGADCKILAKLFDNMDKTVKRISVTRYISGLGIICNQRINSIIFFLRYSNYRPHISSSSKLRTGVI